MGGSVHSGLHVLVGDAVTIHAVSPHDPAAYALAYWLASEDADLADPEDCRRMIFQRAPKLIHFGVCVSEALPLVDEAAALARENLEAIR